MISVLDPADFGSRAARASDGWAFIGWTRGDQVFELRFQRNGKSWCIAIHEDCDMCTVDAATHGRRIGKPEAGLAQA